MHSVYKNKKVFITGHTGFKGSWLNLWLEEIGAEVAGYSLAPEPLSHFNLLKLKTKNYFNNINDFDSLKRVIGDFNPDIVFHLAAQPLVRDSYDDPITTYDTNVLGSLKVYQACLQNNVSAVVSITTDKVYENKEIHKGYSEDDQLGGHDPYSSSKACMEIMTTSFRRSYLQNHDMLLATARAGNVIGGGDWAKDRLIPDIIKNTLINQPTPIRNPASIRPWQHVLDPLNGYLLLGEKLINGNSDFASSFNFGPNLEGHLTVEELGKEANKTWDKIQLKYEKEENVKHEANLLMLNITKAQNLLKWQPLWDAPMAINQTIDWYKNYYKDGKIFSKVCLQKFLRY